VSADDTPPAPAGELALDGCRWRTQRQFSFDLTWTPVAPPSGPTVLPLELIYVIGDQGSGVGGLATVDAPGAFTVDVTIASGAEGTWQAGRDHDWLDAAQCGARAGVSDGFASVRTIVADPRPATTAALDPGSIEGRAAAIDLLDEDARLLPLAWLYADPEPPGIDRLYVHPTATLVGISVELDGSCWKARSLYTDEALGDDVVEVVQRVGCPPSIPQEGGGNTVPVADEVWDVTAFGVAGVDAAAFAAEMTALFSERISPFDPGAAGFDPDRYLDEHLAVFGLRELHRFDWESGRVLTAVSGAGLLGMDVLAVIPGGFNGSSSSQLCIARATFETTDESGRGFFVVAVVGERTVNVDEDGDGPGEPVTVPLVDSGVDDIRVGLHIRAFPNPGFGLVGIEVTDPDGTATACVQ
jgi:hypothetical protein